MSQPYFDSLINCLEQFKDEIGVILEGDDHYFFYVFPLISNVYINIYKFKKWIILHNDY